MARSERAAGLIPFIIMLVLFLVALGWGYVNYSAIHNTETGLAIKVQNLEDDNMRLTEVVGLQVGFLRKAAETSGFASSNEVTGQGISNPKETRQELKRTVHWKAQEQVDATRMAAELLTRLTRWQKDFSVVYDNAQFSVEGNEIKANPDGTKNVDYFFLPEDLAKGYSWRQMPDRVEAAMNLMKSHLLGLAREYNVALEAVNQAKQTNADLTEQKDRVNNELRTERDNLKSRYENEISTLRDQVNRLDNRVREAEAEKQQVEEDAAKLRQDYDNQILAYKQAIKRLKVKIDIERAPTADGEVLAASSATGIAVINRGKADNLKPGTVFEVYNFAKGGVKRAKGLIKVLDVYETRARCGVLQMNAADPIVVGDLIANELYNPGKTLHFFILGKLGKYGVTEATALLEKLGNKVDSKITVDTDYLIIGRKANENDSNLDETPEYKKAKELGLKVITERELEAFTRY